MAKNVTAAISGGKKRVFDEVDNLTELKDEMGLDGSYVITVNGETVNEDDDLPDYSFVTFGEKVKGGQL